MVLKLHQVECEELLPPAYKKGPGIPKKLRRREADEAPSSHGKYRRSGTTYRCTRCDKFGHNAKGCKSLTINPNAKIKVFHFIIVTVITFHIL